MLMPLLLGLVLLIKDRLPALNMNGWFLDDGLLGGKQSDLAEAARIILENGPALGLELSTVHTPGKSKSSLWCKSVSDMGQDLLDMGIAPNTSNGIIHLGAPL